MGVEKIKGDFTLSVSGAPINDGGVFSLHCNSDSGSLSQVDLSVPNIDMRSGTDDSSCACKEHCENSESDLLRPPTATGQFAVTHEDIPVTCRQLLPIWNQIAISACKFMSSYITRVRAPPSIILQPWDYSILPKEFIDIHWYTYVLLMDEDVLVYEPEINGCSYLIHLQSSVITFCLHSISCAQAFFLLSTEIWFDSN